MNIEEDFILNEQQGSFRSSNKKKSIYLAMNGCCCCCYHIIGAYIGAYIGSVVGSGISYKKIQRENEKVVKYRWLFLWSFLSFCAIAGVLYIMDVLDFHPDELEVPLVVLLTALLVLVSPCVCLIAAKTFSWRILLVSLLFSAVTAAIGFGIGWIIVTSQ